MGTNRSSALVQGLLFRRGGKREGAGRRRQSERDLVPHAVRDRVTRHQPVLVTTRLRAGLPNLRQERTLARLREVLAAGADRRGFRLVEYSLQSNHIHFLAEAPDQRVLARGVQGLLVRVARALNRIWGRTGRVVADRYHARVLKSPRAVRNALVYVLQNARKHGAQLLGIDACSSGPWFRGWLDRAPRTDSPLPRAESWLLKTGWLKGGLIATHEAPVAKSARESVSRLRP
jgi:REP element-mobilizing transposase RayT